MVRERMGVIGWCIQRFSTDYKDKERAPEGRLMKTGESTGNTIKILTVKQVAELIQAKPSTVYSWAHIVRPFPTSLNNV